MKKIGSILIMVLMTFSAQAQEDAIEKFFSKYLENENFSRVYISPKMMQMAGGFLKSAAEGDQDKDAQAMGELISKLNGVRILSGEKVDGLSLFDEAMGVLNRNKYEELMDVRDKESSLKFLVKEENGKVAELLMISGSDSEFTLLSLTGRFTYQDLNMLAEKTDLPGMDAYQKGKKQK
ncbi:DUF4252 domain-containing protein [Echinicola jeungdonensis]|uniref:DUF4252 domain-containing protein n=1 Tax=Echinicola jeungdonensis TaxID=709343 RepID=A0ABV5J4L0_9BACT|nr:DUF4252 domain-containing protein [Echinicola jeungdonensis]MDN3668733.1 DUF4252 domain-containing protein [Echinicola jeungdonensis]